MVIPPLFSSALPPPATFSRTISTGFPARALTVFSPASVPCKPRANAAQGAASKVNLCSNDWLWAAPLSRWPRP